MMTVLFKDVQNLSRAGFPVIAQLPVQSFSENIETADPFFCYYFGSQRAAVANQEVSRCVRRLSGFPRKFPPRSFLSFASHDDTSDGSRILQRVKQTKRHLVFLEQPVCLDRYSGFRTLVRCSCTHTCN